MFFLPYNMIKSEGFNQFLKDTCESAVVKVAFAASFSTDEKKRIVTMMEILNPANPPTLHQKAVSVQ